MMRVQRSWIYAHERHEQCLHSILTTSLYNRSI
jgi:hypothetical protein